MGYEKGELSILFTDDRDISILNKKYLRRDGPTNIIAFPMISPEDEIDYSGMLGDIVISVDTARREAMEQDVPLRAVIYRLLIHGVLHLMGYDHEKSSVEAEKMEVEERRLFKLIEDDI